MALDAKTTNGIGRSVENNGRCIEVLHMVNRVDEYLVQELTEVNEKKLKSTTDEGVNLTQRRWVSPRRGCAGSMTGEVNRGGVHDFARDYVRDRSSLCYVTGSREQARL